uniref:Evasin n=1 Tax=Rhipicephalus appendiculatus TaxID=34631 RepID=A0A131Z589_RHIAP
MIRLFSWATIFLIIACCLRHSKCRAVTFHINHVDMSVFYGEKNAQLCHQHSMQTPAGTKIVSCEDECTGPETGVKPIRTGTQCLNVSIGAMKYLSVGVNYTCELGKCDANNRCHPFDLLIGCWKEQ